MSLVMTFQIQHERHDTKEIKNLLLFIEHSQEKEKASHRYLQNASLIKNCYPKYKMNSQNSTVRL